jgi:hypothetical protein
LIALAAGLWLARLGELLLSPVIGVLASVAVIALVWKQEKRLIKFASAVVLISLSMSFLQIWSEASTAETSMIENQLTIEGEFTVQSDSSPFGEGFRTWIDGFNYWRARGFQVGRNLRCDIGPGAKLESWQR